MKIIVESFKRIGYEFPEYFFNDSEKMFSDWNCEIEKISFNEIKKINTKISIIDEEIKIINKKNNILLRNECNGNRINIPNLLTNIYSIKVAELKRKLLEVKKEELRQELQESGKTGGRPKKLSGKSLYLKPNGLIESQLNSHLLMKYYFKFRPEYFKNLTPDEICLAVNSLTFYQYSSVYPFFEDAILALVAFHNPEKTDEFFIYTCELETFIKESGAAGKEKARLLAFLYDNFTGESVFKSPVLRVEKGKIEMWNTIIFNADLGITEAGIKKIKVYLNRHIFGCIINENKPSNYLLYPRQLSRKLINATNGRWSVHIRPLYELIQRDLEKKSRGPKELVFVLASINYGSGFKNNDTFEINVTRAKEFFDKAIPAIDKVGIQARWGGKRLLCGVEYEIQGSQVIFSRKSK